MIQIAVGPSLPLARRLLQGRQHRHALRRRSGRSGRPVPGEALQLRVAVPGQHGVHAAPRLRGYLAGREQLRQLRERIRSLDCLEREGQRSRSAGERHSALLKLRIPVRPQDDRRPLEREVDERIRRLIEGQQGDIERPRRRQTARRQHRLEPDARIDIGGQRRQQRKRIGQSIGPRPGNACRRRPGLRFRRMGNARQQIDVDAIDRLGGPQGLELGAGEIPILRIEVLHPRFQGRPRLLRIALGQGSLRLLPGPRLLRLELLQHLRHRDADEFRDRQQRPILGDDAPDSAVTVISARIVEVDLVVLDDLVVPVGDVESPVGPHLHVDGPELAMLRRHQRRHLLADELRAGFLDVVTVDELRREAARDEVPLPVVREVPAADECRPAVPAIGDARQAERRHHVLVAGRVERGIGKNQVHAVGPGGGAERSAPRIEGVPPGVGAGDRAIVDFEPEPIGPKLPDAAAPPVPGTERGLDVGLDVETLVEIEIAVRPPAERVERVMRILRAEAGEQDATLIRLAGPLRVLQMQQHVGLPDVDAAVSGGHAGRHRQLVGEHGRFLRLAVGADVFEHGDEVFRRLARQELRIAWNAQHPEPTRRIEVDLHRIDHRRLRRDELQLEAGRQRQELPLDLGIVAHLGPGLGSLSVDERRRRQENREAADGGQSGSQNGVTTNPTRKRGMTWPSLTRRVSASATHN